MKEANALHTIDTKYHHGLYIPEEEPRRSDLLLGSRLGT